VKISIVGAGISGLATAQAILKRNPQAELEVFESASRVGGKVESERTAEGYLCEWGVNGFLDKIPRTLELCREVGVAPVRADKAAQKRFIFSEKALHQLPEKPPQFFTSRLLSIPGRLRVVFETVAGGTDQADESLAEFATRRLGREAFEKLIDPMASGVFAGDATRLSLKSCFPRIHELENEYGSLIRGLISLQKKARREKSDKKVGAGPGGTLTSFADGMSVLTDRIAQELGPRLRLDCPVAGLEPRGRGFALHLADGTERETDALVLAVPAYVQSRLLRDLDPELAALLSEIEYPALAVVCFGYDRSRIKAGPEGFGFLVPSREKRTILGTVVDSNVFPGRAPEGHALLRSMVGGARSSHLAELPEEQLLDRVKTDLREMTGLAAEPDFVRVYRHQKAIPQYQVGHAARLDAIETAVARFPGLVLTGNAFRGVSLNDCVVNAWKTAERLIPESSGRDEK
jgi:oxygen-dependent protoporphyrinogen oxidase